MERKPTLRKPWDYHRLRVAKEISNDPEYRDEYNSIRQPHCPRCGLTATELREVWGGSQINSIVIDEMEP